ncbi:FkbM family methyltransferase [Chryseobacterium limigenitum]|uniref:Methyltransferase, FkbM family n=1 Tax=Chryseobacterium limigenitum TaxID=1612149 RepID=A0A1K2IFX2_9FLAO|nr:FkbM family methyltransferase [Chryseobacterium limigenitum]SFZ91162.1 methyltransferase, FkbM family [Chryseobacterium limigenitum]
MYKSLKKSFTSIFFQEGIINFIKRKQNISFLDNRKLFIINYNNKKTKIFLNKKFGYVDFYIFKNGIYEQEIIDDIRNTLSKDKVLLDIGANIGQHSLLLAPYCKQIYAFEPIPDVYKEFSDSIKENKYQNVKLFNTAIGKDSAVHSFNYVAGHAGMSSFIESKNPGNKIINVQVEPLKKMIADTKFDVVKLDVEGYEAVVVLGNKDIFLQNRPIFFMEFCPLAIEEEGTYTPQDLIKFFLDNNYKVYSRELKKEFYSVEPELIINDNLIITPI